MPLALKKNAAAGYNGPEKIELSKVAGLLMFVPSQNYTHPDDHNLRNYDMTPWFKPFTV